MTTTTKKQPSDFAKSMMMAFYTDQTKEKSFELSNLIKSEMVAMQERDRKNVIKCENLTEYILISTVAYLINSDKQKAFVIEGNIKTLSFKFSVFTENMTNRQIRWYNSELSLDIPENGKETQVRDEEAEEALQTLFAKGCW